MRKIPLKVPGKKIIFQILRYFLIPNTLLGMLGQNRNIDVIEIWDILFTRNLYFM